MRRARGRRRADACGGRLARRTPARGRRRACRRRRAARWRAVRGQPGGQRLGNLPRCLQAERSSAKRKLSAAPSTPNHTPKQIQRGNRPCRIDPLLDHTPIAVKTAREQQCFYCNVRSCWFMCKCCEAPLHIAVAAGGARNAWPCFARYHMPLNNKHNHAYNRAEQTTESWSVDPDVTAVRQADQQRRKQKPVNERVQIGVQHLESV